MVSESDRKNEIATNLARVRSEIPKDVRLIVVTKNFPVSDVEILFELGERDFGENRVQELVAKRQALPASISEAITWHFQGQIQSNKVALLNQYANVIHSIDSTKTIEKLSEEKRVFLQINLDPPEDQGPGSRAGIDPNELRTFAEPLARKFGERFLGVMGIAPHFPGIINEDIEDSFARLEQLSQEVRSIAPGATAISAGMSDDYRLALRHSATHLRLGSSILGRRG